MKRKSIFIFVIMIIMFVITQTKIYAANMGLSINKSSAYVGDSFSITISGINGRVNISSNANVILNKSGSQWVDGSLTITGTAKTVGTGTITVKPVDATTTSAEPEEVTASASRSITIKQKETPPPQQETPATPTKPNNTSTNKINTSNSTKNNTTTKTETKVEEKKDDFYITKIDLMGIKENEEKINIELTPEFNKITYEYSCTVSSDVKKIEIEKEAGEYTNYIIVKGGEEIKEGENIITLMLAAENHQAKTYTIKVTKETAKQEEVIETGSTITEEKQEIEKEEKQPIMISMPLWIFIVMQILIIIIEILIIYFVPWRKIFKRNIKNIDMD